MMYILQQIIIKFNNMGELITVYIFVASLSEDDVPVKVRKQENSTGFSDFCVKNIRLKDFGRREIVFAEQGKNNIYKFSLIVNI